MGMRPNPGLIQVPVDNIKRGVLTLTLTQLFSFGIDASKDFCSISLNNKLLGKRVTFFNCPMKKEGDLFHIHLTECTEHKVSELNDPDPLYEDQQKES